MYGLQGFDRMIPDYSQSIILYEYYTDQGSESYNEMTGVIENVQNIWMHPPRTVLFRILELNPFPFIQRPYEAGNKWSWELSIGSPWGDNRWKTWEGRILNEMEYEITGLKKMPSRLGMLECWEVIATAKSELGKTSLKAYFHEQHGFVKLDYTNIDGSSVVLDLEEVKIVEN